jgi:hypothetical protein
LNIEIRLMVRPGITGWAQVNGGILLTPDEKERLDEFYVRNASPWLDLRIVVMTTLMFFRGDRRTAHVEEPAWTNLIPFSEPLPRRTATQRTLAPSRSAPRGKEHAAPSAARF